MCCCFELHTTYSMTVSVAFDLPFFSLSLQYCGSHNEISPHLSLKAFRILSLTWHLSHCFLGWSNKCTVVRMVMTCSDGFIRELSS